MNVRPHRRLPLTSAQTGVWYAQRIDPDSPVYNVGQYVEIRGGVEREPFEAALRRTVAEAEALGMVYGEQDGVPYQEPAVGDDRPVPSLTVTDLRGEPDPDAAALVLMRADMHRPADPADGGLFAFALYTVADDRVLWYQRIHHLAADAYTFALLTRRVAELYTALVRGLPAPASPFGPLAPVLEEEAAYRDGPQFALDRAYWADRMAGRAGAEPLSGTAHPAAPEFLRRSVVLPDAVGEALLGLAARCRGTWADVVIAAFAGHLHRLTGSRDVVLSLPAMTRMGSAALSVPVMTVNVLPLRLETGPADPVSALVRRVVTGVRELRRHQRYRGEDLTRDLGPGGRGRGTFGPMVNIKVFDDELDFAGSRARPVNIAAGPVDDLTLSVYLDGGRRLRFELDANPNAYREEELEARAAEFARLLTVLADAGPDTPLGALDFTTEVDRGRLAGWNATAGAVVGGSVVELFAARVG
ncbi:condensation domain-containing protein, partial [Kitasatospora sp. NPDC056327]|uniref:condensation domain-containing protein n=1 Tax=Kitasatospora sp. NPDC056327 TaxID=3345785 RepID=UPI0035D88501